MWDGSTREATGVSIFTVVRWLADAFAQPSTFRGEYRRPAS
jgi:hypothetical protein